MIQVWIPHGQKIAVKDLPPGCDPADPPLTERARYDAARLTEELCRKLGAPCMIFHSPKRRCIETAAESIAHFGKLHAPGGVLTVGLNSLAQPENGDSDPLNPSADANGLVYYGERSTSAQWLEWFRTSAECIRMLMLEMNTTRPVYVFTHRPLVAAARLAVRKGFYYRLEGDEKIDPLDPTLLPCCIFDVMGTNWHEMDK